MDQSTLGLAESRRHNTRATIQWVVKTEHCSYAAVLAWQIVRATLHLQEHSLPCAPAFSQGPCHLMVHRFAGGFLIQYELQSQQLSDSEVNGAQPGAQRHLYRPYNMIRRIPRQEMRVAL